MLSYLDDLDQELTSQPGFKKPPRRTVTKKVTTSTTDSECGYIHHGNKRGVGYLMEATVDCKHGIVTGVDVFPANEKESFLVLRHLERQQKQLNLSMEKVALDRGYDTGAVHRGLELLGITGYIPTIRFPNDPSKYGFSYNPQQDTFICPMGQHLVYHRLNCNQSTGKYLRCYQVQGDICKKCPSREGCFDATGARRRILASSCYPAFYRGHSRVNTPEYLHMMRKRKIWAEGSFAAMKREHNLSTIHKRGILAATEECLLSAMALNLKRMVKAIFPAVLMGKIWAENMISQPIFYLCQRVQYLTLPIQMLGGNEFRLRQGFRLRRKRLYAAKAAPARRPVGQSSIYWGNFKISILTVPSRSAPDEPLRFVWRFFFHCPSPPSGHEAFLVPEYKLSGVEFDAIIQLARAHLAESEAG